MKRIFITNDQCLAFNFYRNLMIKHEHDLDEWYFVLAKENFDDKSWKVVAPKGGVLKTHFIATKNQPKEILKAVNKCYKRNEDKDFSCVYCDIDLVKDQIYDKTVSKPVVEGLKDGGINNVILYTLRQKKSKMFDKKLEQVFGEGKECTLIPKDEAKFAEVVDNMVMNF